MTLFITIGDYGSAISCKVKFGKIGQVAADHHVFIEVEDAVWDACYSRCGEETIENNCDASGEKQRFKATVIDQMHDDGRAQIF